MAKPLRIALLAMLVILVLLVLLGFAANTQWARGQVEARLSEQFDGREVEIADHGIRWGFPLGIRAEGVRIANADWADEPNMLEVDRLNVRLRVLPLLRGALHLSRLELERPVVHLARQADGTSNWDALIDEDRDPDAETDFHLGALEISDGHLSYGDAMLDADLSLDIQTSSTRDGEHALQAEGDGRLLGEAFRLSLRGAPPAEALEDEAPYALSLTASLGQATASFEGEALDLAQFEALQGLLALDLPAMPELLGQPGLTMPALRLNARVAHGEERWALEDIDLQAGNSRLSGSLAMQGGEIPEFDVDLRGEELNLDDWNLEAWLDQRVDLQEEVTKELAEEPEPMDQSYAARVEPLRDFRARVSIALERLVFSGHGFQGIALRGELNDEALRLDQFSLVDGAGSLAAVGALGLDEDDPQADLSLRFEQLSLGNLLAFIELEELGVLDGQLHARFAGTDLILEDTRLDYRDPETALNLEVRASPRELDDGRRGLQLNGDGARNEQPFTFELALGPLLDLDNDEPYPVAGAFESGDTRATLDGSVAQPLDVGQVDLRITAEGPNATDLNRLLDLALPFAPDFRLQAQLRYEDQVLELGDLDLRAGESDLQGDMAFAFTGRPRLTVDARSTTLDLDDLLQVVEETTELDEQAEEVAERERVFSDEPLDLDVLRDMDAVVSYRAERLISNQIPLDNLQISAQLEEGELRIQPLQVGLGEGTLVSNLHLDARQPQLQGRLDLNMTGVGLGPLLRNADLDQAAEAASGVMGGNSELRFSGSSMRELMSSLDGGLELIISGGHLDSLIMEVLGLHVGEALVTALTDSENVGLRCAYARLESRSGLIDMQQFLISTEETNFTADGNIDLNTEQLEIALESHRDDISVFSVDSPIELHGPLNDLNVRVLTGGVIARGAASVVGALIAPPLAILPWIEGLGADDSPGCREVIEGLDAGTDSPSIPRPGA